MKRLSPLFALVLLAAPLVGCGADSNTSSDQEQRFKDGQKATPVTIPPDAGKRPPGFKSSLDGEGVHAPTPGANGPGPGGPAGGK